MEMMNSLEAVDKLTKENDMALVYFGGKNCNVCSVLKPKVIEMLGKYPKIKNAQIDVEDSLQMAAAYNIFTIPAVLLFIEGKETLREVRHISIQDLEDKISRYYELFF